MDSQPTYFNRAHLAFRLLGLTGSRLEWMQLLTKAMADYPSAILYPEQLIVNHKWAKSHANDPAVNCFRVYGLQFDAHASSVTSKVSWHEFHTVKLRNSDHLQGRASHNPATLLKWDMVGDILYPELKVDKLRYTGSPAQLGTYLPWLATGPHANPGRGHSINMLFAEQADAVALGARLLNSVGNDGFRPPSYMATLGTLRVLAGQAPF